MFVTFHYNILSRKPLPQLIPCRPNLHQIYTWVPSILAWGLDIVNSISDLFIHLLQSGFLRTVLKCYEVKYLRNSNGGCKIEFHFKVSVHHVLHPPLKSNPHQEVQVFLLKVLAVQFIFQGQLHFGVAYFY